jgi:DNA polymerase
VSLLFLDLETRSEADLPSVGAYRYAAHPSTSVICAAYTLNNDAVGLWRPGHMPIFHDRECRMSVRGVVQPVTLVAHNAEFEKSILREVLGIDLPIDRFVDTAAMAARMSLPRKLEDLAKYFGLDTGAKEEGKLSIQRLCKPWKGKFIERDERPDLFAKLEARCVQDVELTRTIYHRLLALEPLERRIWQCTIEMNERGLRIDRAAIAPAQAILAKESEPLVAEFTALTGCKVKSYAKVAQILGLPNTRKPTVRKALRGEVIEWEAECPGCGGAGQERVLGRDNDEIVIACSFCDGEKKIKKRFLPTPGKLRALEIFQALSKSSVAKLEAMLDRMGEDDRVRGSFLYCGADRTGRWSANGLQPQNFPRGLGHDTEVAFAAMFAGVLEEMFVGMPRTHPEPPLTPTSTIANMLRGFIVGPLIVGDLSQIEARGLNWLAGQQDTVELFATGGDPYCAMASRIYGRPISKKHDPDERFMGKQAVLGAGYGLGAGGFQYMLDDSYDRQIDIEFAQQVVDAYRAASPKVTAFWKRLNDGFMHVVRSRRERVQVTGNIAMGMTKVGGKDYAFIELPSSRRLYYAEPKIVLKTPRWKGAEPREVVEYWGRDLKKGGAWCRVTTYGGKLAENATQAFSRDVIAFGMLNLRDAGFHLNGTVHDELIAEDEPTAENMKRFHDILVQVPEWAPGLPLEAEVFAGARYRK